MNRVRLTVDDLRRASDAEIRQKWSGRQWVKWLDAAAVLHDQTFRNVVLIKLQMPTATQVADFETWRRHGRWVPNGGSGIRIISPAKSSSEFDLWGGSIQGHGVGTVWDLSQTHGRELWPPSAMPGAGVSARSFFDALRRVAGDAGYSVRRIGIWPDCEPVQAHHDRRNISVRGDVDDTVAAELAHARMHKLGRSSTCQGLVRLEAESVAYLVLAYFGRSAHEGPSVSLAAAAAQISKKSPVRSIQTLGNRVVTTARRLIQSTEEHLDLASAQVRTASPKLKASHELNVLDQPDLPAGPTPDL